MNKVNSIPSSLQNQHGQVTALLGDVVYGWARLVNEPQRRAVVDILADGYTIGVTTADVFDNDLLQAGLGDGCHAFVFPVQAHLIQEGCRFTAQLANAAVPLSGHAIVPPKERNTRPRTLLGTVNNRGDLRVTGWVWDPQTPKKPQQVLFYEGSVVLTQCLADKPSAELIEKGFGDGRFAYSCTLPVALNDGNLHHIRAMVGDKEIGKFAVIGQPLVTDMMWTQILGAPQIRRNPALVASLRILQSGRAAMQRTLPSSFDFTLYADWLAAFGTFHDPTPKQRQAQTQPHFLVVIEGDGDLAATLSSLEAQKGANWKAYCIQTTATPSSHPDINWVSAKNWAPTLRDTIRKHSGFLSCLRAGDQLASNTLAYLGNYLASQAQIDFVFADSDGPAANSASRMPWCKPAWDPHLQLTTGYASMAFACRSTLLKTLTGTIGAIGDLANRALAQCDSEHAIQHLPYVGVHHAKWPTPPEPDAAGTQALLKRYLPGALLLQQGPRLSLLPAQPSSWPSVSLIIPTRDRLDLLKPCIDSLLATDYPELEIVIADNDSVEPETNHYLQQLQSWHNCRVVKVPGSFNYASINNIAVASASGQLLGLLNNDIEAKDSGWLKAMVSHLLTPGIGAVGAKLLWPNGMVQHGGVITGLNGVAGHIGNNWFKDDPGYFGINHLNRRVSAVTAACLLCTKQNYIDVGGLDSVWLQVNFNDVDLCLKLRERGLHILWTPDAQLLHHESASRGSDQLNPQKSGRSARETHALLQRWGTQLNADPYYSPNLNLDRYPYTGLAVPPRKTAS